MTGIRLPAVTCIRKKLSSYYSSKLYTHIQYFLHKEHNLNYRDQTLKNLITNYNQQDATFLDLFISTDVLHVSGGSSAHYHERLTVHTVSRIVNQYCY